MVVAGGRMTLICYRPQAWAHVVGNEGGVAPQVGSSTSGNAHSGGDAGFHVKSF